MRGFLFLAAAAAAIPFAVHAQPTTVVYDVPAPQSHGHASDGWGLYATVQGRSLDLDSHDWADDPRVQSRDIEAGYGWRGDRLSAVVGYDQHDYGPKGQQALAPGWRDPDDPHPIGGSGVLGLSLVLHAP